MIFDLNEKTALKKNIYSVFVLKDLLTDENAEDFICDMDGKA